MEFIPKNIDEEKAMLKEIGINSIKELFSDIPEKIRLKHPLNLGNPLSESELRNKIQKIAGKNKTYISSFLGAGSYNHYIPSIVNHYSAWDVAH